MIGRHQGAWLLLRTASTSEVAAIGCSGSGLAESRQFVWREYSWECSVRQTNFVRRASSESPNRIRVRSSQGCNPPTNVTQRIEKQTDIRFNVSPRFIFMPRSAAHPSFAHLAPPTLNPNTPEPPLTNDGLTYIAYTPLGALHHTPMGLSCPHPRPQLHTRISASSTAHEERVAGVVLHIAVDVGFQRSERGLYLLPHNARLELRCQVLERLGDVETNVGHRVAGHTWKQIWHRLEHRLAQIEMRDTRAQSQSQKSREWRQRRRQRVRGVV